MGITPILPIFVISAPRFVCHHPLNRFEGWSGNGFKDSSNLPPSQHPNPDLSCHVCLVTYCDFFVT